jgi:hypothetical protein
MIASPIKSLEKVALGHDSQLVHVPPPLRPRQAEPKASNGNINRTLLMRVRPEPPVSINAKVELRVESVTDNTKESPSFAYVSPPKEMQVTRLTIAINSAWWPAAGAMTRRDEIALKWLAALALTDRIATWPDHPILRSIGDHLAHLAECSQRHQRGAWTAYRLRDHDLLCQVPELLSDTPSLPTKFAEFTVSVDAAKLAEFRVKMAKRTKKRPVVS